MLEALTGVEGPDLNKLHGREEWCLIVDRFSEGKYLPCLLPDLESGEFRGCRMKRSIWERTKNATAVFCPFMEMKAVVCWQHTARSSGPIRRPGPCQVRRPILSISYNRWF